MTLGATLLLLGKGLFAAAGVLAGVHVLRLARGEGAWGVHTLAAGAILTGGLSLILLPLGQALGPGLGSGLVLGGEVLMRVAVAGLWVFLWRVFHPGSTPVAALAALGIVGLWAACAWDLAAQPGLTRYDPALPSAHAVQLSLALPFLWSSWQSGRAHLQARRRRALGLSDAMTCERFRLWAIATALLVAVCVLAIGVAVLDAAGRPGPADALRSARGLAYLPIAACVWLGMAPPAWYRARVEATAPAG